MSRHLNRTNAGCGVGSVGSLDTLVRMRDPGRKAVAVISVHASPMSELGQGENGGMNLAIRRVCEGLSERGIPTDVLVRREDEFSSDEELIAPMSRLVRLPVGPARGLPSVALLAPRHRFAAAQRRHARSAR